VSIPSNVAEGACRRTTPAFVNHVSIALGSHAEIETCIEVALRLRRDTEPLSRVYWEYGVYTDAAGTAHPSLTPMFRTDLTPSTLSTDYQRFYFAPTEYATVIPYKNLGTTDTRFQPFLANLPVNGRVQLQLPMDLDGKHYTYTFTFEPAA